PTLRLSELHIHFKVYQYIFMCYLLEFILLKGIVIHEYMGIAVRIKILHLIIVYLSPAHFFPRTESFLLDCACAQVSELTSYKGRTFARLDVLEVDDSPDAAFHFYCKTCFKIVY